MTVKSMLQKLNEIVHATCLAYSQGSVNVAFVYRVTPVYQTVLQPRLNSSELQAQAGEVPPRNQGLLSQARSGIPAGGTNDMDVKDYPKMAGIFRFYCCFGGNIPVSYACPCHVFNVGMVALCP